MQRSRFAHALRFARASALFFAALSIAFARSRTRTLRARKSRAFRVRARSKTCARRTKTFRGFRGENDAARAFRSRRFCARKALRYRCVRGGNVARVFGVCASANRMFLRAKTRGFCAAKTSVRAHETRDFKSAKSARK
eukprot:gene1142-biopygen21270